METNQRKVRRSEVRCQRASGASHHRVSDEAQACARPPLSNQADREQHWRPECSANSWQDHRGRIQQTLLQRHVQNGSHQHYREAARQRELTNALKLEDPEVPTLETVDGSQPSRPKPPKERSREHPSVSPLHPEVWAKRWGGHFASPTASIPRLHKRPIRQKSE